ncbi:hypothetical protein K7432_012159 [Basidiobolus ranarum]|uniref:Shugoshin C-terminal domain-containing protein n=1 Tax=Basidiobolus ranarum TaxID=34480 RepID=A0ABR2WL48_9FUNG
MNLIKVKSIFKKNSVVEDSPNPPVKTTTGTNVPDNEATCTLADTPTNKFNITSCRMNILETENCYLYEQNRKLSRDLRNAQRTNEALLNIARQKDRQIDNIIQEHHEAILRAHAIEQSMKLMLLNDDKHDFKTSKTSSNHAEPESLLKFVTALKSVHPLPCHANASTNLTKKRNFSNRKCKYSKPLLPPLPTILDEEERLSCNIGKELHTCQTE